jgi:hypothetical protein
MAISGSQMSHCRSESSSGRVGSASDKISLTFADYSSSAFTMGEALARERGFLGRAEPRKAGEKGTRKRRK